jgi:hypothetical protein
MSSRRKRDRAHHQPEAVVVDFVTQNFLRPSFSALYAFWSRSLVTSALQLRVEGAFQQTLETALILAFANPIFLFHRPTPLSRAYLVGNTLRDDLPRREKDRTVPLGLAKKGAVRVIALRTRVGRSVRRQSSKLGFDMQRKVGCTICDSVTVRSARRRTAKKEWLPHGALIALLPQAHLPLINVFLDVPSINRDAVALTQDLGLPPVFETARMYTGAIPPLRLESWGSGRRSAEGGSGIAC